VQHAIIAGDETTGVSVFRLVEELDAGDLLATVTEPIGRHETAGNLLSRLAEVGARLLVATVDALDAGTAQARPQVGDVTVAPKLTVADGRLDFGRSAREVHDRIRGVTPEPGAHTTVDGVRLKVWEATIAHGQAPLEPGRFDVRGGAVLVGTATEPMELLRVQPAGRTAMDAAAWWRGRPGDAETVAE
jgi:methionyl-tRNA formyltransferase